MQTTISKQPTIVNYARGTTATSTVWIGLNWIVRTVAPSWQRRREDVEIRASSPNERRWNEILFFPVCLSLSLFPSLSHRRNAMFGFRWLRRTVCPAEITSVGPCSIRSQEEHIDWRNVGQGLCTVKWIPALMEAFSVSVNIYRKCILISCASLNTLIINHNALCIYPCASDAQGRCFSLNNCPYRKQPSTRSRSTVWKSLSASLFP